MEEKNQNKAKEVAMNTSKDNKEQKPQKYTYEQLNEICSQLFQQNQQLAKKLQQLSVDNTLARLTFLFKVLEFSSVINDADFVNTCIDEIKESLIIPEEKATENKEE